MTIVQRTPNLGLTLRMQRASPAAANPGSGGDGIGPSILQESWDFSATREFLNRFYDDWRVIGGDVPISAELHQPFRVVYVGGSTEIVWNWVLDTSTMGGIVGDSWSWDGVTVEEQDGTALVAVGPGWVSDETFRYSTLVLTPSLNGTPFSPVSMRLVFNLWAE